VFADLNEHLSDKTGADAASGGRHPLPSREKFARWLSSVGLDQRHAGVVYDRNGANYCGRLWWMLKWAGHDAVAVLDGGLQAWQAAGGAVASGEEPSHFQTNFTLGPPLRAWPPRPRCWRGWAGTPSSTRAPHPRFRGEVEPLDPVAGHIPGALNRPFQGNIGPDGRFKAAEQLRRSSSNCWLAADPASVVHHCGSGVSAVPNLIAMELAGLGRRPCTQAAGANGAPTRQPGGKRLRPPQVRR
jgi:thiosulfate/3-mercaptopyruvate sulfurtransferase